VSKPARATLEKGHVCIAVTLLGGKKKKLASFHEIPKVIKRTDPFFQSEKKKRRMIKKKKIGWL